MTTRILIELVIECETRDAFNVANRLLDNGQLQALFNDLKAADAGALRVKSALVSYLEDDLREILWPEGNAEAEHSADTLEALARRVDYLRPTPVAT